MPARLAVHVHFTPEPIAWPSWDLISFYYCYTFLKNSKARLTIGNWGWGAVAAEIVFLQVICSFVITAFKEDSKPDLKQD